jgi:PAS domain S-box-containing protein
MDSSYNISHPSPEQHDENHDRNATENALQVSSLSAGCSLATTERQRAEEQLLLQATILRYVTDSVIVTDLQGRIIYWNEGASAVFGYTAEETIGKCISILAPALDLVKDMAFFEGMVAGHDFMGERHCRCKNGAMVWVDGKITILRDTRGTTIGLIGIFKDITARKEAEERLRQSEKLFRALVENMVGGLALTDAHGIITYMSPSTTRIANYPPEELVGQRIFEGRVHPADQEAVKSLCSRVLAEPGKNYALEYRSRRKDGGYLWVETVGLNLLHEPGIEAIVWNYRDITERKEMEQEVARAKEQLEIILQNKDHFISMASHELKTPLTVLRVYTQLLLDMCKAEGRQDIVPYLFKMDDQTNKLTNLVVDLLDISKMQAGQIEMAREAVNMEVLVRETIESLQPTTSHRLSIEGKAPGTITGDRERLGQVLIILLNNAIKYSPHADTVVVRLARAEEEHLLTVAVQDFGIGIGKEHQGRLFQRFYRALSKQDKTFPGMGIGLYIAHEIIQLHGGKMWVESIEGSGSTFYFSLPA